MSSYKVPMYRRDIKEREKGPIVAYDLETSRIPRDPRDPLSVEPKFITTHGADRATASIVSSYHDLGLFAAHELLVPDRAGVRYVAWNANRFDVRLLLQAILEVKTGREFTCVPFVAKQGGLRGVSVNDGVDSWYFYDGMTMLGLQCKLDKFLEAFAPEYRKLELNLDAIEFDPNDASHVEYAKRDSEGLYVGMIRAEALMVDLTGRGLQTTIGNAGIKNFVCSMPEKVFAYAPHHDLEKAIRDVAMRGGYVYVSKQYDGKAWSYDINQAYAAAMRETDLPSGQVAKTRSFIPDRCGVYLCTIARSEAAPAPFYVRSMEGKAIECFGDRTETILCSNEIECLRRHGWEVEVDRGWIFSEAFRMEEMVANLEALRKKHKAGTPVNTLCKSLGNNAYGKMNEQVPGFRYVFSLSQPEGALPADVTDLHSSLWVLPEEKDQRKFYHRPQVSCFITAAVRVKLYDAIMLAPDAFLKADTDSVTFSRPVRLPLSRWEYGKWKRESAGDRHIIIGKKCYCRIDRKTGKTHFVCKGLHVKKMTIEVFERWFETGVPPTQTQMQLQTWKRSTIAPNYKHTQRRGTDFTRTAPATVARKVKRRGHVRKTRR